MPVRVDCIPIRRGMGKGARPGGARHPQRQRPEQRPEQRQKLAFRGMAGWGRLRGTLQVPLRGPAQPLAAVRSGACEAVLRKQSALTPVSSVAPSMALTPPQPDPPAFDRFPRTVGMAWPALGRCRPWSTHGSTPCVDERQTAESVDGIDAKKNGGVAPAVFSFVLQAALTSARGTSAAVPPTGPCRGNRGTGSTAPRCCRAKGSCRGIPGRWRRSGHRVR